MRSFGRFAIILATGASSLAISHAAGAQQAEPSAADTAATEDVGVGDIVVTAQRRSESIQNVPIAITAFDAEALEKQQIRSTSDLQLSIPSVTFTKSNFASSNFTIRGIGDAAIATSGDTSIGIAINEMPLVTTRLFETDYFDLERVEVLRGPQGTLFGRNSTGGVINFVTAKPDLSGIAASAVLQYANYDTRRAEAMFNLPLTDTLGVRVAGTYLKRDGYTDNLYAGNKIDGRDQYAVRGTLRWQPTPDTTLDLMGYYFKEDSNRSRIQKQLCHRDPTGVLGCLPDRLANETLNNNAALGTTLASREFFRIVSGSPAIAGVGLGSVYGPDSFAGVANPADLRTVNIDFEPTYVADEVQLMGKLVHGFGPVTLNLTGGYTRNKVDSRTDYNLAVQNPLATGPGSGIFALRNFPTPLFANAVSRLFRGNELCVSEVDRTYTGYINGKINRCSAQGAEYDNSRAANRQYSVEAHLDSDFDGPLNFLLGGIYVDNKADVDYFVASSGLDYATAVIGALQTGGAGATASPFASVETNLYRLKSYGLFGEAYYDITDELKLTGGLRYSHDKKFVRDRAMLFNFTIPYGTADAFAAPNAANFDADASRPGKQAFRETDASFGKVTGRVVLDWTPETSFSDKTLVYASYSRGYKSGGINPAFDPSVVTAPALYRPEMLNAFEIGTKNTFLGGQFRANLSAFYYDYKGLQISRLVARSVFNDNVDAKVYGVEGEFVMAPTRSLQFNVNASYLHTEVAKLQLIDPRDPSGGRPDSVLIKDLAGGANCVVAPKTAGNAALANAFVTAVNAGLGLRAPTPVPGTATTGAFSMCAALAAAAANPSAALSALLGQGPGPLPIQLDPNVATAKLIDGIPVDLTGNQLPNSPKYKVSLGAQYTADIGNKGMNAVFRIDYALTGTAYSRVFNRAIDRVPTYDIVNAQVQLNGVDDRWFARAFVQNLFDNDAVTGQFVADASSGLFTNIFTLEPRRYGIALGFRY